MTNSFLLFIPPIKFNKLFYKMNGKTEIAVKPKTRAEHLILQNLLGNNYVAYCVLRVCSTRNFSPNGINIKKK